MDYMLEYLEFRNRTLAQHIPICFAMIGWEENTSLYDISYIASATCYLYIKPAEHGFINTVRLSGLHFKSDT